MTRLKGFIFVYLLQVRPTDFYSLSQNQVYEVLRLRFMAYIIFQAENTIIHTCI
jgi:hypothetical protein